MQSGRLPKVAMAILGAGFGLAGLLLLVVASIGNFSMGRGAVAAMGIGCLAIATPFFAFLHSRQWARRLAAIVLLAFAGTTLWLSFRPNTPAPDPTITQAAAIALTVLLLARIGLALRAKRTDPET